MTAPAERNLGGLATTDLDRNPFVAYDFFRIDLATGTVRLTNFPEGYVGNIDGTGSQTWVHSHVAPDQITWSQQGPDTISWVELWNFDNVWSNVLLNGDLEFKPVQLYQAHFNPTTGALLGQPQLWQGRTDKCDINGGTIRMTLVPDRSEFAVMAPFVIISPVCQNVFQDPNSCQYAGIAKPTGFTAVDGGSGSKSAATFFYAVTALHGAEETDPATANVTIALNHKVNLSWTAVTGATGYNVYYGTTSTVHLLNIGANVQGHTFVDNNAAPPVGSQVPPLTNGTGTATTCGHAQSDCKALGNLPHRVAWDTVLDPNKVITWSQGGS